MTTNLVPYGCTLEPLSALPRPISDWFHFLNDRTEPLGCRDGRSLVRYERLVATLGGWITAFPATLDDRLGVLAPVVAGAATAIAVALAVAIYFASGYRTSRDVLRHSVATVVALGLLAFAAYDMRHVALDYLGINPPKPALGFETHDPTPPRWLPTRFRTSSLRSVPA